VAIEDKPIKTVTDLNETLEKFKVGDQVTLTVERDGENVKVPVTLEDTR
jgi:S1-C subfamily serine protease